MLTFRL